MPISLSGWTEAEFCVGRLSAMERIARPKHALNAPEQQAASQVGRVEYTKRLDSCQRGSSRKPQKVFSRQWQGSFSNLLPATQSLETSLTRPLPPWNGLACAVTSKSRILYPSAATGNGPQKKARGKIVFSTKWAGEKGRWSSGAKESWGSAMKPKVCIPRIPLDDSVLFRALQNTPDRPHLNL